VVTTSRRKLTEPLGGITVFFGIMLLASVLLGGLFALIGSGSIAGIGHGLVCENQPDIGYGVGSTDHLGVAARPGATIDLNDTLQACALHPGLGQRALYSLTILPGVLVWGAVLFLLWRMTVAARRSGPFTLQAAVAMRRLGWVIIVGSVVSALVQRVALGQLLNTMLTTQDDFVGYEMIPAALAALLPVPALAGAALLTMARIIRLGADMDEEIKATV
jgi:hypothetical protein